MSQKHEPSKKPEPSRKTTLGLSRYYPRLQKNEAERGKGQLSTEREQKLEHAGTVEEEAQKVIEGWKVDVPPLQLIVKLAQDVSGAEEEVAMKKLLECLRKVCQLFKSEKSLPDSTPVRRFRRDLESIRGMHEQVKSSPKSAACVGVSFMEWLGQVRQVLWRYQLYRAQTDHDEVLRENIRAETYEVLEQLLPVPHARFDAHAEHAPYLVGSELEILAQVKDWYTDKAQGAICWLTGDEGCGKSSISRSFAEKLFMDGQLGASFFCSCNPSNRNDLRNIFPTLAYQLATSRNRFAEGFRRALCETLSANENVSSPQFQLSKLVVEPLLQSQMEALIIIDGLDECQDLEEAEDVLSSLCDAVRRIPNMKVLFSTRRNNIIATKLESKGVVVIEIPTAATTDNLKLFLRLELLRIAQSNSHVLDLLETLEKLTGAACGSFTFASVATRVISIGALGGEDASHWPQILQEKGQGVDMLYSTLLDNLVPGNGEELREGFRLLLGLLHIATKPLSLEAISELLQRDQLLSNLRALLPTMSSVLRISTDMSSITFLHRSFFDFLTRDKTCDISAAGIHNFDQLHHQSLAVQCCFEQMERKLKINVCKLPRYAPNPAPNSNQLNQALGEATRYCCRYWAEHLLAIREGEYEDNNPTIRNLLYDFLAERQLLWFEALSLLGELESAKTSLNKVHLWLNNMEPDGYLNALDNIIAGQRFLSATLDGIRGFARHIYHSALPFFADSLFAQPHHGDVEAKVLIGRGISPSTPINTIQVPDWVRTLHYSQDGSKLAAGGDGFSSVYGVDGTVKEPTIELEPHFSRPISAVSFSSHPTKQNVLVTASRDAIRVWELGVAGDKKVTELAQRNAYTVAFHPSESDLLLVCDLYDDIFLWDLATREPQLIERIDKFVGANCWYNGPAEERCILLGLSDGTVALRTIARVSNKPAVSEFVRTFPAPADLNADSTSGSRSVTAVTSSHRGDMVASGLSDGTVIVYDAQSAKTLQVVQTTSNRYVRSLSFSPTTADRVLAYTSGHAAYLCYVDSSDEDDANILRYKHDDDVRCAVFSPDGRYMATGADDGLIRIWNMEHHSSEIICFNVSNDGKFLLTGSLDKTIRVWNISTNGQGGLKQILRGHTYDLYDLVFLKDNSHFISVDYSGTLVVWTGTPGGEPYRQLSSQPLSPFTPDGSRLIRYTHNSRGFFHSRGGEGLTTRIDCWTLSGGNMVLAAQGSLSSLGDELVMEIGHMTRGPSDIVLVLECKSGKRVLAYWEGATKEPPNQPRLLGFVEAPEHLFAGIAKHVIKAEHYMVEGSMSPDEQWILGEDDQKILWVPRANRSGFFRWDRRKLILVGYTGLLTVIDFAGVEVRLPSDSRYVWNTLT